MASATIGCTQLRRPVKKGTNGQDQRPMPARCKTVFDPLQAKGRPPAPARPKKSSAPEEEVFQYLDECTSSVVRGPEADS